MTADPDPLVASVRAALEEHPPPRHVRIVEPPEVRPYDWASDPALA